MPGPLTRNLLASLVGLLAARTFTVNGLPNTTQHNTVASERNQHCEGETRLKRPKLEARMAKPGPPGSRRGGYRPSPPTRGFAGALRTFQWDLGLSPGR